MPGAEVKHAEVQGDDCSTWAESGADTETEVPGPEQPARSLQLALS